MLFSTLFTAIFYIGSTSATILHRHEGTTYLSVERSIDDFLRTHPGPYTPRPLSIADVPPPSSLAAKRTHEYAIKEHNSTGVYGHLRRSHFFSSALLDPALGLFSAETLRQAKAENINETLWHAIILHDIGLTPANIAADTPMSFDLIGAIQAQDYLKKHALDKLTRWQIDDIAESILWHTDLILAGKASLLMQVAHLGIGADAIGSPVEMYKSLLHEETLKNAAREWPRTEIFRLAAVATFENEGSKKPGSHWTIIDRLAGPIDFRNPLLDPFSGST